MTRVPQRGDGTGGFAPKRYTMIPRFPNSTFSSSGAPLTQYGGPIQSDTGLVDLNGDGLSEHWKLGTSSTNICWANGTSFETVANGVVVSGTFDLPIKPGEDAAPDPNTPLSWTGNRIDGGVMQATRRLVDVDQDGRVDIVDLANASTPRVQFNAGAAFLGPVDYPGIAVGSLRQVRTTPLDGPTGDARQPWEVLGELIDLDGDGIPESGSFAAGFQRTYHTNASGPPRLLATIDNGRGALTTVTYASMHDKTTVEQHPDSFWADGRPKATPVNQWVVKTLETADHFAGTNSKTTQYYRDPRHGADDEGRYAFRGFEQVWTTTPGNAMTVEIFDYLVDWSGRLVESRVLPTPVSIPQTEVNHDPIQQLLEDAEVRSIERVTWVERPLFSGLQKAFHVSRREHFTCANGQKRSACTVLGAAPAYTNAVTSQNTLNNSAGQAVVWVDTDSELRAGDALADGDRRTTTTFTLSSAPGVHRLRPLVTTKEHRVGGAWTIFGKTAKTWDPNLSVMLSEEVWFDTDDSKRAITRFVYDMTTGNVIERWKPVQNAANSVRTVFTYDPQKLFVATTTNELGHVVSSTYEYGTGTKLTTTGPNTSSCGGVCPPNAPQGSICMPAEQSEIKIDAFGRTLEHWDTISDDGCTYYYHKRQTTSYTIPTPTTPTSITEKVQIDANEQTWTEKRTDIDGIGRPIKETVFVFGTAPADQVTTFTYSDAGTLTSIEVPDPSENSVARVAYTYSYDSLARPRSVRRPDATALEDRSGIDIDYDGVTKTTLEVVGAAGGNASVTKTATDRFGRLVQVDEQTQGTPAGWATTAYAYGPNDLVSTITDPEMVTTSLTHDFAGRRTAIARQGRTWEYTYDRNGNVASERIPGSTGPLTDANYINTTAYDDLDRPVWKMIGPRDLSTTDQELFAGNTERFFYDIDGNMKGKLRTWASYGTGNAWTTVPLYQDYFRSDTQGRRWHTNHRLGIAGYNWIDDHQWQTYYLFGAPNRTYFWDRKDVHTDWSTEYQAFYDRRGLLSKLVLNTNTSIPASDVGVQTRNVAGLVTKRRSTPPNGPMSYVESNWTYDELGRVTSQVVQKAPAPAEIARQDLAYLGNDDPASMQHWLGTSSKQFTFAYDSRHQLTGVTTDTAGYFDGTYEFGPSGRLTRAAESQTISPPLGSEVQSRDVAYVYGGIDPEQVTALVGQTVPSTTYASFAYDAAGNQKSRCLGTMSGQTCVGESLEYVYDGKDQLRRVTKKSNGTILGSEEYWYDAWGARIAIVKRDAQGNKTELITFTGGAETHYDGAGAPQYSYSDLSMGTPVARVKRTADTLTTTEYQFHGLASSTLAAVGSTGAINTSFRYSPWGTVLEATDGGAANGVGVAAHRRRQNDKYVDEISNLSYYGARYYDKLLISWTQADPLYLRFPDAAQMSSPRRASIYAYSLQNALRYIDPDGLSPASNLQSYKSEAEEVSAYRRGLEADANWTVKFTVGGWGLPRSSNIGCGGGLTSFGSGVCGLSDQGPNERADEMSSAIGESLKTQPHKNPASQKERYDAAMYELENVWAPQASANADAAIAMGANFFFGPGKPGGGVGGPRPRGILPANATVVRGGQCRPEDFSSGTGVTVDTLTGKLSDVSVNLAPKGGSGALVRAPKNGRIGVTTAGQIRDAGGSVNPTPTRGNPDHGSVSGLTADTLHKLFTPTIVNPYKPTK